MISAASASASMRSGSGRSWQVLGIEPAALAQQDADAAPPRSGCSGRAPPGGSPRSGPRETRSTLRTSWRAATHRSGSTRRCGMRCTSIDGIRPTSRFALPEQPRHQRRRMVARREQVRVMALQEPPGQRLAVQEVDDADAQLGQGPPAYLRHRVQEVLVGLGLRQLVEQQLHALDGRQRVEDLAQHPDPVQLAPRASAALPCGCPTC